MTDARGPFGDAHFLAVVTTLEGAGPGTGWTRRGRPVDWPSAGSRGIGNDDIEGLPAGMPVFRYGRDADGEFLAVAHEGYSYSIRDGEAVVTVRATFPETVLTTAPGRLLRDIAAIPGLERAVVERVLKGADAGPGSGQTSFGLTPG